MIFSLSVIAIFVAVSVYFFFKAEGLHRQLISVKRDTVVIKKENKALVDSMAVVAKRNEESVKSRLNKIKEVHKDNDTVELFLPLLNNYSMILLESLKGKGQVHKVVQKCSESYEVGSFKRMTSYIVKQDTQTKRIWRSNSLSGFMLFVEMLLQDLEQQ